MAQKITQRTESDEFQTEIKEKNPSTFEEESNIPYSTKREKTFPLAPIGLYGFSISCILPGLTNLGAIKYSSISIGAFTLFGGLCQYLYGILGWYEGSFMDIFLSGNYGIFNALFFFINKYAAEGITPPNGKCYGVFNLLWSYVALISFIVGLKGNKVNLANQLSICLAFFFNAIANFENSNVCTKINGALNILIGVITFYSATSLLIIGIYGRTILPLFAPGEKIECCSK